MNYLKFSGGSVSYDEALNSQMDATLKFYVTLRMKQADIKVASTIADLKAIILSIADVPQDLDNVLGKWSNVKDKFTPSVPPV